MVICVPVAKGNEEIQTAEAPLFDFTILLFAVISIAIGVWFVKSGRSLLPRRGALDVTTTPGMAIVLYAAMLVLSGLGAWWGMGRGGEDEIQGTAWMYGSSMIAQLPIVLLFILFRRKQKSRRILPISCIAFMVFVPMALTVAAILHGILAMSGVEPHTSLGHETLQQLVDAPWGISTWVVVICVTFGAGLIEEVMYRGLIFPAFDAVIGGKTLWRATFATSALFAVMHIGAAQPSAIAGLFVLSMGLCWARVKSGGVLAPAVIHIVFNAMNIAFVYSTHL